MDEQKLHKILGQDVEMPHMINKKLEDTYARLERKRRPAKRRGLRPVRTVLIAAALVAALCFTATASYQIFRQQTAMDPVKAVAGILSGGQHPWTETTVYNEYGLIEGYWPNRETVPIDEGQAKALLGEYLPECGYQWQIGDYTFTVEGYVLDEHTGTARFYYSVEHPGGFPEGSINQNAGTLSYKSRINVLFSTKSDVHWKWISGKITFVDMERSTPEKLYLMEGAATPFHDWKAEDGLSVKFTISGETDRDDDVLSVDLDLPGVKSLPVVEVVHPETGELAAAISPIAVRVDARHIIEHLGPNKERVLGDVHYIALEYADGSNYVIQDTDLDNADYGMYDDEIYVVKVFNRLVDPSQVTAVIVDSYRYEVAQ